MKRARTESPVAHVESSKPSSRLPKISRKIQACTECQTRKIKCDVSPPEKMVCSRCDKKGLRCVVNKNLQSLLEETTEWKASVEENTQCLKSAVSRILSVLELPALETFGALNEVPAQGNLVTEESYESPGTLKRHRTIAMAMTRENSQDPESNKNDELVSAPMGSLFEVTKLRNIRSQPHRTPASFDDDFISQGKVSEIDAQQLFESFRISFNHYLWGGIALVHESLSSGRQSSSLLVAAILTVTALHIPGKEGVFDICYAEFISLVSDSMFDRYHSLDGIRGLCIGAFWLSDVSWKLSGHAVRIATELNLHQSYARAMRGNREHIEGARLWYFLYVCDHHFSIAYGRPPVIHNDRSITDHEQFLTLPSISQSDFRLHSQVAVFIILTDVYNAFGPDVEQVVSEDDLVQIRQFNNALDKWRVKWEPRLAPNLRIGTYPARGVGLHYNFAKLQVSSLVLRGVQPSTTTHLTVSRRELANMAISCAISTLQMALDEPDVRQSVVGIPIYLHTMITYSAVFLLKVQQKWKSFRLGADPVLVQDLVSRTIEMLREQKAGERHLSNHIATGLGKMLDRFTRWEAQEVLSPFDVTQVQPSSSTVPNYQSGYGMNPGFPAAGAYDKSLPFFDEHYFPMGFFDVLSSTQFDTSLWQDQH